jgi:hypothetical protein
MHVTDLLSFSGHLQSIIYFFFSSVLSFHVHLHEEMHVASKPSLLRLSDTSPKFSVVIVVTPTSCAVLFTVFSVCAL